MESFVFKTTPTAPNAARNIARHSLQMVINITTIGTLITVFPTTIRDFNYNLIKFERCIRSKEQKKKKNENILIFTII